MSSVVADGHPVIGRIRAGELHRSVFEAFVAAFECGVDARRVDALVTYRSVAGTVTVRREDQKLTLERDIAEATAAAKQARKLALKWSARSVEEDDEFARESDRYAETAFNNGQRIARLQAQLKVHEAAPEPADLPLPDAFETDADLVVAVLRRLARCAFQLTPSECADVQEVMQLHWIEERTEGFRWSASLLLPYDGHVLSLGPVEGTVQATGLPSLHAAGLAQRENAVGQRKAVRYRAQQSGVSVKVGRLLALGDEYLPRLSETVLGLVAGQGPQAGTPDEWADEAFLGLLEETYGCGDLRWNPGIFLRPSPKRQALTDVVAAAGGCMTGEEFKLVAEMVGLRYRDLHSFTLSPTRGRELPWLPSVTRDGSWAKSTDAQQSLLRSVFCPDCALPATGVLRVPEVIGSLVCRRCRRLPARAAARLPVDYLDLLLPETAGLGPVTERLRLFRSERREDLEVAAVVPGRWHSRYSDERLTVLLRDAAIELGPDAEQSAVVDAVLQQLGYVRRGGSATPRLRALWVRASSEGSA